jgi:anti-sigma B factor antagonist
MQLSARVDQVGELTVLCLAGDVDLGTVPVLHDALNRLVDEFAGHTVAVDLDAVDTLDDVGLGTLLGAAARTRDLGGELVVICSGDRLVRRATRFDRAVAVYATATAAATAAAAAG